MTPVQAAATLGISIPRFSGASQESVDALLVEWKDGPLKNKRQAMALATHPDTKDDEAADEDATAKFNEAKEAHECLLNLRVRLCPPPAKACPLGHERIPEKAKFCHECGHEYDADPLIDSLRRAGILPRNIDHLRATGELDELRRLGAANLQSRIQILQQRQRLGLFGPHTGWR